MPYDSVLLFGPPGCGKGTVGKSLSAAGGHFHFSSGDMFRNLDPTSELGVLFKSYSDKGLLCPDELTVDIWRDYMKRVVAEGKYFPDEQLVLLDGIPRTVKQTELMNGLINVKAILLFDVPDREVLIERLRERALKQGRVDDADVDVLHTRQRVYHEQTAEVLAHYSSTLVHRFNADQKPLEVLRDILNGMGDILSEKFRLA
jgi:adenylate kinase